ncbi:hypothetical protein X777_07680, partial [Ooceraea biroi]
RKSTSRRAVFHDRERNDEPLFSLSIKLRRELMEHGSLMKSAGRNGKSRVSTVRSSWSDVLKGTERLHLSVKLDVCRFLQQRFATIRRNHLRPSQREY